MSTNLQAQIAFLEKDAARLDWMQERSGRVVWSHYRTGPSTCDVRWFHDDEPETIVTTAYTNWTQDTYKDWREAIDAAMLYDPLSKVSV